MNEPSPAQNQFSLTKLLFLVAVLAHVPLGLEYAARMWRVGHYQFFPMLMAVVGWLIYDRVSAVPRSDSSQRSGRILILLALDGLLLIAATILYSSLLWIISLMFLIMIAIFERSGWMGIRAAWPAWLLLAFAIPLPLNLDLKLITKMQFVASQLASWMLDSLGLIHFREGVVLVTEKKQFFTEEACSGIRSLFSSLAAIAIYGVLRHYGIWRHIFNLLQTTLWVIVGNAIRIAIVVYVADNWTDAIATGTNHEMLGMAVFLFIFLMALGTDRALNVITGDPTAAIEQLEYSDDMPELAGVVVGRGSSSASVPGQPVWQWALILLFGVSMLFSGRLTYAKMAGDARWTYATDEFLLVDRTQLPEKIGEWEVVNFEHALRQDTRLLAPESFLWTLTKDDRRVTISLDSPYDDYHELTVCYSGLGWSTEVEHQYNPDETTDPASNFTKLDLSRPNGSGIVLFSAHDQTGRLVLPKEELNYWEDRKVKLLRNIRMALGTLRQENDPLKTDLQLPVSQVQLFCPSAVSTPETEAELLSLFLQTRRQLLSSPRFAQ